MHELSSTPTFRAAEPSVEAPSAELLAGVVASPSLDGAVRPGVMLSQRLTPAPQGTPAPLTSEARTPQRPILIIDDHPDIRDLIAQALSDEGYQVETYSDAEAALGRILSEAPGLVLLDLMMPRMSGWQMIGALRERRGPAHVPVVLLSASRELRQTAEQFGVEYLPKPFNLNDLLLLVERVVGLPGLS